MTSCLSLSSLSSALDLQRSTSEYRVSMQPCRRVASLALKSLTSHYAQYLDLNMTSLSHASPCLILLSGHCHSYPPISVFHPVIAVCLYTAAYQYPLQCGLPTVPPVFAHRPTKPLIVLSIDLYRPCNWITYEC